MENKNSSKGKAKFNRFKNSKTGLFNFNYVDGDGKILLTGEKEYQNVESRDNGIRRIKTPKSYAKIIEENGKFYFLIKAGGNHAKLGISSSFNKREAAEKASEFCLSSIKKPTPRKTQKVAIKKIQNDPSPRQAFRLTFYPAENKDDLAGNIEHILTDKKRNFRGLDMDVIQNFIEENLKIKTEKTSAKKSKKETNGKLDTDVQEAKDELMELTFLREGQKLINNTANHTHDVDLQIKIAAKSKIQENVFDVYVFAKSMKTSQKTLTGQIRGVTQQQQNLSIPLNLENLEIGPYRIISSIEWYDKNEEKTDRNNISESSYLLVV